MNPVLVSPDATLDFGFDWSQWMDEDDQITTSDWTVPGTITLENETQTATQTVVWLSGFTEGMQYRLVNTITTAEGREDSRSLVLMCVRR